MANYCFGCGPDNPFGLHLHFSKLGDNGGVQTVFTCEDRHMGWPGIQHGGITGALLDEASGYVPYVLGQIAVTAELTVSFRSPVRLGETLHLSAVPTKVSKRVINVEAMLVTDDGTIRATSTAKMVILTKEQQEAAGLANSDLPGFDASYEVL